ncbi:EPIDERMAL PATTERNING FACTOR-like protein 1 isoform X2 [Cucurbita maxima]|uniref:Epidermal patterning factor-like protein n=1 Tax=Cucurbita maxima TaxID=3661 RepID=A0A6J1I4N2_CUCMA|nr:EPIDERMAL PATTERNING FACTOR-like protein 1 isoform X2 [Cucurbita maxima]
MKREGIDLFNWDPQEQRDAVLKQDKGYTISFHCSNFVNTSPPSLQFSEPFFPISTLQSFSHSLTQNMALNNSLFLILPLIFSLSVFLPTSGNEDSKQKELAIGSRPPKCFNKCLNCKPCVAALVISQRLKGYDNNNGGVVSNMEAAQVPKDDAYYLLSWKCKCKDKYFQP